MPKARRILPLLALVVFYAFPGATAQTMTPTTSPSGILGKRQSANYLVTLISDPSAPTRGPATLEALVTDAEGKPIDDAELSFDLDMTNMRMGKNIVAAASQGKGHYLGRVRFSMPGPWRIIVRVARPGQAPEELRFDFKVNFR